MFSPDRPEALRRAVEGHRGAGLHRPGRLRRGAGDAHRRASGWLYATAEPEDRYRLAATARTKDRWSRQLVDRHAGEQMLVIGAVPRPARRARRASSDAPVITGETTVNERERLFEAFRAGEITHAGGVARWRTSPSTCRRRRWRSRSRARSARARRRRSGSAGCCGPKADGGTARFYAVVAARHRRPGLRRAPAAVPGRAGLRVPDRRRRRRLGWRGDLAAQIRPSDVSAWASITAAVGGVPSFRSWKPKNLEPLST